MLRLRFAEPDERAAAVPPPDAPDIHVWRNKRNGIVATGYRHDNWLWMHWPYLATFRFASGDAHITAFPVPNSPVDVIWDTYCRSVLPMALQALGFEALHASAIRSRSAIVAFCAVSETGKSTIAYGLRRRGFPHWSDDGVIFRMAGVTPLSTPLPFEVRLRAGSRKMFGHAAPLATRFQDNGPGEQVHTDDLAIGAICLLDRAAPGAGEPRAQIRTVSAAEAFPAMLIHAHEFDPFDGTRREGTIRTYLDLVEHVPVFEVRFAPDRERIDQLLDDIVEGLELEIPTGADVLCSP